ncbi:uncharacterized protein LOC108623691 isoform X2 [Ceratina calcarata]|uniref:Uncharacterized protein LOC108623691 isoform X2 n=1 Tax=Ceratina calcarata TaxID=156304 RepID=A0AAJ7IUZ6_9HYME|nr:uncharacterized protein LOC108623691 isoform X2 [Ceratina calcarata]
MRFSLCIYWIAFLSPLIGSITSAKDLQEEHETTDLKLIEDEILALIQQDSSWMIDESARSKRNGEIEVERILTRHKKHRKRRRCKNQSTTCLRGTSTTPRGDEAPVDETSEKLKLATESDDRVQDSHTETKEKDHNINHSLRENDGIIPERNASINQNLSDLKLTNSSDGRSTASESELPRANPSFQTSRKDRPKKGEISDNDDYVDEEPSAMYSAVDEQYAIPESITVLLNKLFQALGNTTNDQDTLNDSTSTNETTEDPCQKWINSKDKFNDVFASSLTVLPACPCLYPNNIVYDDKIWDEKRKKNFRWRDVSGESHRLDVYKSGATYCIRSALTQGTGSAAAQHCCYDSDRKLLTRGSGAGTPHFISAEVSTILHEKLDILPWRLCKGDFSRYNAVRPPNNENNCETNPEDEEYQRQVNSTKYY